MTAAPDPFISILLPVLNEENYVAGALASLIPQTSGVGCEILVIDGGSTDLTARIVELISSANDHIKLVHNEKRLQSAAVNLGAKIADARSRYLLRVDCHAHYPPNFIARCVKAMPAHGAASVVVPMQTVGVTCFQKAVASAQNSRIGNGGAPHRRNGGSGFVDHGHHAMFNRDIFLSLGGYDETFSHNEDAEYDLRLAKAGYKIWMDGEAAITYFPRASISALAAQYFNYGSGRAGTFLRHNAPLKARQIFPFVALLSCLLAAAASPFVPWALIVPSAYFLGCMLAGLGLAIREKSLCVALFGGVAAMTMHMAWAAGFLWRIVQTDKRIPPAKQLEKAVLVPPKAPGSVR
jgi:succinoglycan biosynthesis protein ExoA